MNGKPTRLMLQAVALDAILMVAFVVTLLMGVPVVPWVILGISVFGMTAIFFGIARSNAPGEG